MVAALHDGANDTRLTGYKASKGNNEVVCEASALARQLEKHAIAKKSCGKNTSNGSNCVFDGSPYGSQAIVHDMYTQLVLLLVNNEKYFFHIYMQKYYNGMQR